MNNKGVPGLRKLCCFQFVTNDENVNVGVHLESDPENIAYPNLSQVRGRRDARGTYLAHRLVRFVADRLLSYCVIGPKSHPASE